MEERAQRAAGRRIDRRRMVRAGGALSGAAALLGVSRVAHAHADDAKTLKLDVAVDGRTYRLNRLDPSDPAALPVAGDTFIVFGSVYPEGAIAEGLSGPDDTGAIGHWVCRGTFVSDLATLRQGAPLNITTVLFAFGEGLSATEGQPETAADGLVTEGFEPGGPAEIRRGLTGGFGRYAGARGEVIQTYAGDNETRIQVIPQMPFPAPNFVYAITWE